MKQELGIKDLTVMYVGNLETYQGIDLLLESFAEVLKETARADLVIIGGQPLHIQKYRHKAEGLGIGGKVHFLGPREATRLAEYLSQADILVSPRVIGKNTPTKIYSYLHSGRAVLATNLPTHTQVLHPRIAQLVDPCPDSFAEGMLDLIENDDLRVGLGQAGKRFVEERFTYSAFRKKLNLLFDWLQFDTSTDNKASIDPSLELPPEKL